MHPDNQKQFFEGAIHLIFGVVVAQGFTIAGKIFLPITNLYSYAGFLQGLTLIFVYFFTLTAWYGYFKSVKIFPHKKISPFTIARSGVAVFNTFLLYYMITLCATATDDNTGLTKPDFNTIFFIVVIYFFMIIVVHLLKSAETLNGLKRGIHSQLRKVLVVTILFLAIFVVLLYTYEWVVREVPNLKWDNEVGWHPIFLILFFGFSIWYRWLMWKEKWKVAVKSENA